MWPSSFPKDMTSELPLSKGYADFDYNRSCPFGTVLIRRTRKEDLMHAEFLQKSFKRMDAATDGEIHYAIMRTNFGNYYGAHASIIVYGLPNVAADQASTSQIWVAGGADGPPQYINAVQAGWHVLPREHDNDTGTYLFTYWTRDGYQNTGCLNMLCEGFIVRSPDFGPGSEISLLSSYNGIQQSIEILLFKDQKTGNWWLGYGKEKFLVGYWPKELFNNLDSASQIDFGGSAFSPTQEASPPMGSGHLPSEGRNKSCYFTQIQLINEKNELYNPNDDHVSIAADIPTYYYIIGNYDSGGPEGYLFPYGGPGGYKK